MDGSTDDEGATAAERVDRRQLLLVACCLAAIVVAAVLAPTPVRPDVPTPETADETPTPTPRAPGSGGGGGGAGEGGETSGGDSGESNVVGGEGAPVPIPGGTAPPTEGCGVLLEDEPIPGGQVTVGVFEDVEPVSGVRVRFDGEPVGRTNENGRVTGRVPYNRTLAVSVGLDADCEFYRRQFDDDESGPDASSAEHSEASVASATGAGWQTLVPGSAPAGAADAVQSGNATGEYAVRGEVNLTVRGDAYPGTPVTVVATIEGVPIRRGNVTLGGTSVGRTDGGGRANVTVPDGRQEVPVTVSRGDFGGRATVDVLLLTMSVQPQEGLPVPGERARVVAEIDGRPAEGVTVSVAGRSLGSTAADGTVGFGLPLFTRGSVVASTSRQSTTVALWQLYVPTVLNLVVLLAGGVVAVGGARLLSGPTAAVRVALAWVGLAVADLALVVGEWRGLGLALLGLAAVGVLAQRRRVVAGGEQAVGTVTMLVMVARRTALELADVVAAALDRVRAFLGRTWTRLTSFEQFAAWLGGLVRKVVGAVWLYLTLRRVGVALFALAELAVATARWGHEGLIASVTGLAVLAVLVALARRDDVAPAPTGDGNDARGATPTRVRSTAGDDEESGARILSIRALWRRFARWVMPGTWRRKTPGEVARAAISRGFPREPVEALTDAFRDVEYGSEPATARRDRAKAAFDRLARADEEDDE